MTVHTATSMEMKSESKSNAVSVKSDGKGKDALPMRAKTDYGTELLALSPKASSKSPDGKAEPLPYPKSVIFIIGNEFCERFSFYGMRAILVLYFHFILQYSENNATLAYHIFAFACYFTPILGAFIADSWLGRYWTILTISLIYAAGNIVLSVASIHGVALFSLLGLAAIALGTGGIKPCVAAFGGDQFAPSQVLQLARFFSFFYISINAGSLLSTFLTPILRNDVSCAGRTDCYPLAFGVPAALMVAAVGLFIVGRYTTGYVMVPPHQDNVLTMVLCCTWHALSRRFFSDAPKKEHWLEYADDKYDARSICEVKSLLRVLFLYLPLPLFWALFDQQGSRWTLQALRMNGQLGSWIIKPDQLQVINPLLIVLLIPAFEYGIYPILRKVGLDRPLQKMTAGGLLAGLSFLVCALVQLRLEREEPPGQLPGHNHLVVFNDLPCEVNILGQTLSPRQIHLWLNMNREIFMPLDERINLQPGNSSSACVPGTYDIHESILSPSANQSVLLYLSPKVTSIHSIDFATYPNVLLKPENGGATIYTLFNFQNWQPPPTGDNQTVFSCSPSNQKSLNWTVLSDYKGTSHFGQLAPFEVEIKGSDTVMRVAQSSHKYIDSTLQQGGAYLQVITGDLKDNSTVAFTLHPLVAPNHLSVFWQLPQYFLISSGEILFSITGLEFSYSQAPASMKSVLQAAWLLTIAIGNLLVALIADLSLFSLRSTEFFFFGGLMLLDMGIFALMARAYIPFLSLSEQEMILKEQKHLEAIPNLEKELDHVPQPPNTLTLGKVRSA